MIEGQRVKPLIPIQAIDTIDLGDKEQRGGKKEKKETGTELPTQPSWTIRSPPTTRMIIRWAYSFTSSPGPQGVYIFIYLLYCHPLPSPWGQHTSCQEKSYSKREKQSLRQRIKTENVPFMPFSCKLSHKRTSTLHRLYIAVATHNCGISARSGVHLPSKAPCIPPHKSPPFTPILDHSPCLPDIQPSFP